MDLEERPSFFQEADGVSTFGADGSGEAAAEPFWAPERSHFWGRNHPPILLLSGSGSSHQEDLGYWNFGVVLGDVALPATIMEVDNPLLVEESSLPRGNAIHVTMLVPGSVTGLLHAAP